MCDGLIPSAVRYKHGILTIVCVLLFLQYPVGIPSSTPTPGCTRSAYI